MITTPYSQIVQVEQIASHTSTENIAEIIALAQAEQLTPASQDRRRTLLLAIDVQNDFMEGIGTLPVSGSKEDVERLTQWMYRNAAKLTQVMCSLDCHSVHQIFHASWWVDASGNHPSPFTIITHQDLLDGKWIAADGTQAHSLDYLKALEKGGNKQLCIWPYHCLEGTKGGKLESEFTKMVYYHATARKVTPQFIYKGQNPITEMYGIIKAEYAGDNYINQPILDAIEAYDEIYIAGEASSHCVLASVSQIAEYFKENREITARITLLTDCMSPIASFEESTHQAFQALSKQYGIQLKTSSQVTL